MAEYAIAALEVGVVSTVQSAGGAGLYAGALGLFAPSLSPTLGSGGVGYIADTVKEKHSPTDTPLGRLVRLYSDATGALLQQTWSNSLTGAYRFDGLDMALRYTVLSYDHLHNYRAVCADNLTAQGAA